MFRGKLLLIVVAVLLMSANAMAAAVTMNADDGAGTTSFDAGLHWSDGLAPAAGNAYYNNNYLLRTPATATTSYTFGGDSLTITSDSAIGVQLNDSLMFKGTFVGTTTITVNNLTFNGGNLRHGNGENQIFTLAGNSLTVGSLGMGVHAQGSIFITAPVYGSGDIKIVDNGSNDARRTVHFVSALSTFNGNILLPTANRSRFALDDDAVLNFNIGLNGINNSVSGLGVATFNGDFIFDLTGASTNLGDSWTIASATSQTFGDTFTVIGFNDIGGNLWTKFANGVTYQFSESASPGTLTVVPEPATIALLAIGGLCLRRRKA